MTVETTHVVHCDYAGCDATLPIEDVIIIGSTMFYAGWTDGMGPPFPDYCPLHSPDTAPSRGVGLKHGSVPSVVEPSRAPIVDPTGDAT